MLVVGSARTASISPAAPQFSTKMTEMNRWAIGIDLGGTNVRAAAIEQDGTIRDVIAEPVERHDDKPGEPFAQLVRLVATLVDESESLPSGIGIAATGPVYPAEGLIDNPFTLPPNLQGKVREAIETAFPIAVLLENDANAAALGEYWQGAGRGANALVCLTIGTGVGVGVVLHGAVHRGAAGTHPEAGHQIVDPTGPLCYCGARGCVESLASGPALIEAARSHGIPCQSAAEVFAHARTGDPLYEEITAVAREAIATAATNLVAAHAADVIVLAGGALGDPERVLARIQASLDAFEFTPRGGTRARLAELADLAGCHGAAFLALTHRTSGVNA